MEGSIRTEGFTLVDVTAEIGCFITDGAELVTSRRTSPVPLNIKQVSSDFTTVNFQTQPAKVRVWNIFTSHGECWYLLNLRGVDAGKQVHTGRVVLATTGRVSEDELEDATRSGLLQQKLAAELKNGIVLEVSRFGGINHRR